MMSTLKMVSNDLSATVTKLMRNREDFVDLPPLFPTENLEDAEQVLFSALNNVHEAYYDIRDKCDSILDAEYEYKELLKPDVSAEADEFEQAEAGIILALEEFTRSWAKMQMAVSVVGKLMSVNGNAAFMELVENECV